MRANASSRSGVRAGNTRSKTILRTREPATFCARILKMNQDVNPEDESRMLLTGKVQTSARAGIETPASNWHPSCTSFSRALPTLLGPSRPMRFRRGDSFRGAYSGENSSRLGSVVSLSIKAARQIPAHNLTSHLTTPRRGINAHLTRMGMLLAQTKQGRQAQ